MTYGCHTWSFIKQLADKLTAAQIAMERELLSLKLQDKILCSEIKKGTKVIDKQTEKRSHSNGEETIKSKSVR